MTILIILTIVIYHYSSIVMFENLTIAHPYIPPNFKIPSLLTVADLFKHLLIRSERLVSLYATSKVLYRLPAVSTVVTRPITQQTHIKMHQFSSHYHKQESIIK